MSIQIQIAKDADAPAISETIIKTLRESNARDYPPDIIDRVIDSFSPSKILRLLAERQVLVAALDNQIVATASLDRDVVRSVFVDPDYQGMGVGRQLMKSIQSLAMDAGFHLLRVPSSVTAEGFYASLGFKKVRDEFHQEERTIIMAKTLAR
ncbi:N-acetylglutamate synthase-like GNAT family acetyltransferase [Pseudomonas sp. EB276 TE3739]|uniref:GNAT family N-acetyltransferase n=1 Tax=Pseudomonas TaxID=286 RepID=UPI0020A0F4AD|nr:GNAT family N-acetyltransferase [Pseudomonas koreensis]MCP1475798.1 N-acetylglutamate synthase-like GNAT family acetyltransferase [Pseudomonas koreensis]